MHVWKFGQVLSQHPRGIPGVAAAEEVRLEHLDEAPFDVRDEGELLPSEGLSGDGEGISLFGC